MLCETGGDGARPLAVMSDTSRLGSCIHDDNTTGERRVMFMLGFELAYPTLQVYVSRMLES
jgi:hypothetical protein